MSKPILIKGFESYPIKLEQTGKNRFSVTYGKQIKTKMDCDNAALELGACIMHALTCEGLIKVELT